MLKNHYVTIFSLFIFLSGHSQNVEKEIRQREEERAEALRSKNTAILLEIWAPDYTVNRPAGVVSARDKVLELVKTDTISFASFDYAIEKILIKKDLAIVMGHETTKPNGNNPDAGKTLQRRYTHVWTKEDGNWRLLARHAHVTSRQ